MTFPTDIGIIDLMLGVPSKREQWASDFGNLVRDPGSKGLRHAAGKIDWVTAAAELVTERSGRWLVDLSLHVEKKRGPMADDRAERIFAAAPRASGTFWLA